MKVSPECFIQLCHRVSTLHRRKKGKVYCKSRCKGQERFIESLSEKGQGSIIHPGQRTELIFYMYTNKPRSRDRAYNQRNQSLKTGNNTSI